MPVTGALILAVFGLILATIGALTPFTLPVPLFLMGAVIAVISLAIVGREFFIYRAQRRHIESKRNAKLETSGHIDHPPDEARLEQFLDSQPPSRKS